MKRFVLLLIISSLILTACGEGVEEHQTNITYIDRTDNTEKEGDYRVIDCTSPRFYTCQGSTRFYKAPRLSEDYLRSAELNLYEGYPVLVTGNVEFYHNGWSQTDKAKYERHWTQVLVGEIYYYARITKYEEDMTELDKMENVYCLSDTQYEPSKQLLATLEKSGINVADIDFNSKQFFYYIKLSELHEKYISMLREETSGTLKNYPVNYAETLMSVRDPKMFKQKKEDQEDSYKNYKTIWEQLVESTKTKWIYNGKEYDTKAEADAAMQADSIAESKREKEAELKFYADHGYADWNDYVKHNSTEVVVRRYSYDYDELYPEHYTDGRDSLIHYYEEWEEVEITVTGEYKRGLSWRKARCTYCESHKIY